MDILYIATTIGDFAERRWNSGVYKFFIEMENRIYN